MTAITGTVKLTAPISPTDTTDVYPTHEPQYGKGGHRSVADISARDAITTERREEGMTVYVMSEEITYKLLSDLTTWSESHTARLINAGISSYPAPTVTDNLDGSIDVAATTAALYDNVNYEGVVTDYAIAGITNQVLTDNVTSYLYVDYNSGSPIYAITTNKELINSSTTVPVATMSRHGLHIHIVDWDSMAVGPINKFLEAASRLSRFTRYNGLLISADASRNVFLTGGIVYKAYINKITLDAFNSTVDPFQEFVYDGANWSDSVVTQYNNLEYQGPTGKVTLGNNNWTVNWIFRSVETGAFLGYILGDTEYNTQVLAEGSQIPENIPTSIAGVGMLVGRIIVQKGTLAPVDGIDSAFDVDFNVSPVTSHANLSDLDYASSLHTGFQATINPGGPYRLITADAAGTAFTTHAGLVTDTSGNLLANRIGIGNNSPSPATYMFHARQSTGNVHFTNETGDASAVYLRMINSVVQNDILTGTTGHLEFYVNSARIVRIENGCSAHLLYLDSTDRIGLLTTSPQARLHVQAPTSNTDDLAIFGSVDDGDLLKITQEGSISVGGGGANSVYLSWLKGVSGDVVSTLESTTGASTFQARSAGGVGGLLYNSSGHWNFGSDAYNAMVLTKTTPANTLYLSSTGVGIGGAPTVPLDVIRTDASTTYARIYNSNASPQETTLQIQNSFKLWQIRNLGSGELSFNNGAHALLIEKDAPNYSLFLRSSGEKVMRQKASQTANSLTIEDSTGTDLLTVDNTGSIQMTGTNGIHWGDTGIYESPDNQINIQIAGGTEFSFNSNGMFSNETDGPYILNEVASANNPTLVPNRTSNTTGIGGTSGTISFIINAVEALNIDGNGTVNVTQSTNFNGLYVLGNGSFTTGTLMYSRSDTITTGQLIKAYSNSTNTSARYLVEITNNNTAAIGAIGLRIEQKAAAYGAYILQSGDNYGMLINGDTSFTTGVGLLRVQSDTITTGNLGYFYSNSADTSSRSLVNIVNDNPLATGTTVLRLDQDYLAAPAISVYSGGTLNFQVLGKGTIRINPSTLPVGAVAGMIAIDSGATNHLKWYNGSAWQLANPGATSNFSPGAAYRITHGDAAGTALTDSANLVTDANGSIFMATDGMIGIGAVPTRTTFKVDKTFTSTSTQAALTDIDITYSAGSSLPSGDIKINNILVTVTEDFANYYGTYNDTHFTADGATNMHLNYERLFAISSGATSTVSSVYHTRSYLELSANDVTNTEQITDAYVQHLYSRNEAFLGANITNLYGSYIKLDNNSITTASLIDNMYGMYIDMTPANGVATNTNAYGIYISAFSGTPSGNAYGIHTEEDISIAPLKGIYWGDTGIYESSSNVMRFKTGGSDRFYISGALFGSNTTGGGGILSETSTVTNPSLIPYRSDVTSGIGGVSGTVSLIAGSLEGLTLHNGAGSSTGTVLFVPDLTVAPTVNPTGGGYLYSEAGALKWRGSSGTVTTIAVA